MTPTVFIATEVTGVLLQKCATSMPRRATGLLTWFKTK
jgi:hypothetical protein